MSNTIKLKRGSGSDPSASDLVVGELAIRTDSGKIFTKKDNGSVAEISGGGGIDDGDKGDITISNGGDTFTIDSGVIDNANIASNAAIAGTKISPDFGSQNIVTTGTLACTDITSSDGTPSIKLNDSANSQFAFIDGNSGNLVLHSDKGNTGSSSTMKFGIDNSVKMTLDASGNLTLDGTVDGVDIAARNTLFGGLTSSSGVLTNGVTATTQSAGNNTTRVATTAFVSTAIANLIDSAPGTLNTLNELAAALGDDANFSTTVTNSIATKMPLAGGTFTGNVTYSDDVKAIFGSGNDLQIFHDGSNSIINDNGTGSLQLQQSGSTKLFLQSNAVHINGNIVVSGTVDGRDVATDGSKLDGIEASATADQTASEILTLIKTVDGAGSGLDADTLDGISSASFLRSDADDTCSGVMTFSSGIILPTTGEVIKFGPGTAANDDAHIEWLGGSNAGYLRISTSDDSDGGGSNEYIEFGDYQAQNRVGTFTQHLRLSRDRFLVRTGSNTISVADRLNIDSSGTVDIYGNLDVGAGLDVTGNISVSGTVDGRDVASDGSKLDGIESGATADQSNSEIKTAYEANSNTNAFTDALLSKLNGIAASATNVTNNNQLTNGAGYITATLTNEQVQDIVGGMVSSNTESGITVTYQDSDGTLDFSVASQTDNNFTNADHSKLDGIESGATADQSASEILTLIKTVDGAGSGLDADTLDGVQGSSYLRSDTDDTFAGNLTIDDGTDTILNVKCDNGGFALVRASGDGQGTGAVEVGQSNTYGGGIAYNGDGSPSFANGETADHVMFYRLDNGTRTEVFHYPYNSNVVNFNSVPTVGGTSLARTSDNITGTSGGFTAGNASNLNSGTLPAARLPNHSASLLTSGTIPAARVPTLNQNTTGSSGSCTGNAATATKLATARTIAGVSFDGSANISLNNNAITNGAGYITSADGGNAATLDSLDSTAFLRSDTADTASGDISFQGGAGAVSIQNNSDIRFDNGNWTGDAVKIQHHANYLYIGGGSNGIILREANLNRVILDGDGHFTPGTDSTYDLGVSARRWRNLYADTLYGDGSNLTGISAGATGGGSDEVFYENDQAVTTNYTITNGKNAMAAGPITINSGVTVTVGSGETLTIV